MIVGRRAPMVALLMLLIATAVIGLAPSASATIAPGDATLRVHVTYADGVTPAPFAQVSVCRGALPAGYTTYFCAQSFTPDHTADQKTADENGLVEFTGVAGGSYQFSVQRENLQDYAGTEADDWSLPNWQINVSIPDNATTDHNIALNKASKVTGTIRDGAGQAIPDGTIYLCPVSGSGFGCSYTRSDASGVYVSEPMFGPTITVYPVGRTGLEFVGQSVVVNAPPGQLITAPDIYPDPGTPVSGTVTDELGVAVAGAEVVTNAMNCFFSSSACRSFTDANGGYAMRLPSTPLDLQTNGPVGSLYIAAPVQHLDLSDGVPEVANFVLQRGARIEATATAIGGSMPSFSGVLVCVAPGIPVAVNGTTCQQPDGSQLPTVGRYETMSPYRTVTNFPVPGSYNVRWMSFLEFTPTGARTTPVVSLNIAPGDIVRCTFTVDLTEASAGSSSCNGATGGPVEPSNNVSVPAAVGGGDVEITSPEGTAITAATSIDPATVDSPVPAGVDLPSGAFGFTVDVPEPEPGTGAPATVDITIDYPEAVNAPNGYMKLIEGEWVDASSLVVDQTPTSTTIRLTDGAFGDDDGAVNGVIVDPGAPAFFDRIAPSVGIEGVTNGSTYVFGAVPAATCTSADAHSGLAGPCSTTVTGGTALGVGTYTVTGTATDRAGNTGHTTATYRVVYATSGFTGQVNNEPVVNTGKAGRAYPVTFALRTSDGTAVTTLSAVTSVKYRSVWCSSFSGLSTDDLTAETTGASLLRITSNQYQFNWATPSTAGCYQLMVNLADGTTLRADFNLR